MKIDSGKEIQKEKLVENILLENYDKYYRLAYSYVHNDADAGDIVQNGAYRAIRNCNSLKNSEYAATWIYRIMMNEIFRFYNRKEQKVVSFDEIKIEKGKEDTYENIDLMRALDLLSPKDKAVVMLRFFEDLKIEDIAIVLNENTNTIKSRLYRSMKKLQQYMEE